MGKSVCAKAITKETPFLETTAYRKVIYRGADREHGQLRHPCEDILKKANTIKSFLRHPWRDILKIFRFGFSKDLSRRLLLKVRH